VKVGDLVRKVCRWSGELLPSSIALVTAVHDYPGNEKLDIFILNNDCSGRPQRLGHVYQEDYVVVRKCA